MADLYVADNGSDLNPGTSGQPLLTVGAAVRRGRGLDVMSSLRVLVKDGSKSRETSTIRLTPSDSGVQFIGLGAPAAATVSGSRVISGWTLHSGSIYKATIPSTQGPFFTVFEDGARMRNARLPKWNPGASFPSALAPYFTSQGVNGSHTQIDYGTDFDPTPWAAKVRQARVTVWSGGNINWFADAIPLVAVNLGLHLIGFGPNSRYAINDGVRASRYVVHGMLDFLTEPGEWAYDDATRTLYVWPNGDINNAVIEVPAVYDLFRIDGSPREYVQDVVFDGLLLEHTDMVKWYRHAHENDGDGFGDRDRGPLDALATSAPYDRQATLAQNRRGLISMHNTSGTQIVRCHLRGSGLHAIYGGDANLGVSITRSLLEQTGHSGLYVDGLYPGGGDLSRDWTVSDVKVSDVGQLVGNGQGMIFINSGHHLVSHCTFARGPRNGFFIGAYVDIPQDDCYAEGIVLEESDFTGFCQDSGDVGCIGIGGIASTDGGPTHTNTIRQVRITGARAHASMLDVAPNGVFTDNQSWTQIFENVQVSDTQGAGFRINDSGGHTATNCTFNADGSANASFNAALMSPGIGLTGAFPF
jgi:hypothetical protein